MARYSNNVSDQYGRPVIGASVLVLNQDESLATLTTDGGQPLANPLTTGSSGDFYFNATDGLYNLQVRYEGRLYYEDESVVVGIGLPLPDAILVALAMSSGAGLIGTTQGKTVQQLLTYSQGAFLTLEQFGGKGDATFDTGFNLTNSPTDNLAAWNALLAAAVTQNSTKVTPTVLLSATGNYWSSALPEIHAQVNIIGSAEMQDYGYPNGSCILFPRSTGGLIFQDRFTTGRGSVGGTDLGSARGSTLDGVCLVGIGTGGDLTQHGLQLRTPMHAKVRVYNVSGNGVHIVGYTDSTPSVPYGEINSFDVEAYVHDCGGNGCELGGSDTNAGKLTLGVHQAGGCGLMNYSYYTNEINIRDINGYGNTGVWWNGVAYQLNSRTAGDGGATQPGTNAAIWAPLSVMAAAGGSFPLWVSGNTYRPQQPIYDSGGGAVYVNAYNEQGPIQSYIAGESWAAGGTLGVYRRGPHLRRAINLKGQLSSGVGVGGYLQYNASQAGFASMGTQGYSFVASVDYDGVQFVTEYGCNYAGLDTSWGAKWNTTGDLLLTAGGQKAIWWHTQSRDGPYTSTYGKFGRTTVQANTFGLPTLALGSGDAGTEHRIWQYGTAVPTSGDYGQGEITWNITPALGGPQGWVCTTAGAIATVAWAGSTAYGIGSLRLNDTGKTFVAIPAPAWVAATAYTTGALITSNGARYKATTGGTSATATTLPIQGPIGTGSVTDGTVTWAYVATPTSASSGGPTGTGTSIIDGSVLWTYRPSFVMSEFGNVKLQGSATYDPPSLADGAGATTTVTVTGAALGDLVIVSFSLDLQGITLTGYVSTANTVSVRFQNESGGVLDLASGTLRARVLKA